ncbi:MAG: TRAP transporter small permease subunit [Alphaproteobacteria bacterium]|nr:TRAP transporter small permease subunit [Alphaproteobacteria bacterium]
MTIERSPWRPVRAAVDALGTAVFAAVFVAINLQVFMRYVVQQPVSWSEEFPTLAFTVAVLWAAALMVKVSDHIVFELVTDLMPLRMRLIVGIAGEVVLAAIFALAVPAILDFALYMKALSSPILRIRYDLVYVFFPFFIAALVVHGAVNAWLNFRRLTAGAPSA